MHAVAELVRQGHHVPRLALIVHQDIGVSRRHRRMGEGARRLAGTSRGIDPAPVEEAPGNVGHPWREGPIGVEHGVTRLVPRDRALLDARQRRVAVPIGHRLDAEPACLQLVVTVRKSRIGRLHRLHHRGNDFGLDPVGEVARVGDVGEPAPAVGDLLVLGQRVGDQREGSQVRAEHIAERARRRLADLSVRILEPVERGLQGQLLALDREPQARDGAVEKPIPGGPAGDGLLQEQFLGPVVELERLLAAQVLDPGPVMAQGAIGHGEVHHRVLDPVEFEGEEQQVARGFGQTLLGVAVELLAPLVGGVAGIDEAGKGHQPAEQILDFLVGPNRRSELHRGVASGGDRRDLARITGGEITAIRLGTGKVGAEVGRVDAGIQVRQIPFRQDAEVHRQGRCPGRAATFGLPCRARMRGIRDGSNRHDVSTSPCGAGGRRFVRRRSTVPGADIERDGPAINRTTVIHRQGQPVAVRPIEVRRVRTRITAIVVKRSFTLLRHAALRNETTDGRRRRQIPKGNVLRALV